MKKVLIISPSPSHPQNAGDRARVFALVNWLLKKGFEVHFLYISGSRRDLPAMQQFWGTKLTYVPASEQPGLGLRVVNKVLRTVRWVYLRRLLYGSDGVDDRYTAYVDRQIGACLQNRHFDVVISVYVYYSKALLKFGRDTLKIIDTIDAHALRDRKYRQNVFLLSPEEEAKALNRADVVVAIQAKEMAFFRSITDKKVILAGHPVTVRAPLPTRPGRNTLLFVGSTYQSNVMAIEHFVGAIFPLVLTHCPGSLLVIAGRVCEKIGDYPNCRKIGVVEDLTPIYDMADVAINPILTGRGLKIKNIEALGYGKPLVTSFVGAEGLEEGIGKAFLVGDSPETFAGRIIELMRDDALHGSLSRTAYQFAVQYNQTVFDQLEEVLA